MKISRSRIKRLRGVSRPQFRLRIEEMAITPFGPREVKLRGGATDRPPWVGSGRLQTPTADIEERNEGGHTCLGKCTPP
jgi:hypothetical protein